jgi:hypothetical protein
VCAELERVEPDAGDPLANETGVLACPETLAIVVASGEQELARLPVGHSEIFVDRLPRLLGEFEPDRTTGFLLADRRPIERVAVGGHIIDADRHDIATPQFAINGEVEQREVAGTALELQLCSDRPDLACSQRWLRPNQFALVPGLMARWTAGRDYSLSFMIGLLVRGINQNGSPSRRGLSR